MDVSASAFKQPGTLQWRHMQVFSSVSIGSLNSAGELGIPEGLEAPTCRSICAHYLAISVRL